MIQQIALEAAIEQPLARLAGGSKGLDLFAERWSSILWLV
jgi:hypothetical protein